jgi:nitrate/nitrite transporter NarK
MEFLLGGSWGCFLHINSEYVKLRFGYSNARAAATASVAQIMPVILMPFLGLCVDRYGKRTWMMIGSGLAMLIPMVLLEYTHLPPVVGMLLFSVSLALGPVGLVSSVPVILPLSLVGTGMGIIKSGTNVGATLFDICVGLLQDATPDKGYSLVILFFIVIACLAVVAGITLCILDRTMYHSLLDRSRQEAAKDTMSDTKTSELTKNKINYFYGGLFATLCVTSWVLFGIFVLF